MSPDRAGHSANFHSRVRGVPDRGRSRTFVSRYKVLCCLQPFRMFAPQSQPPGCNGVSLLGSHADRSFRVVFLHSEMSLNFPLSDKKRSFPINSVGKTLFDDDFDGE